VSEPSLAWVNTGVRGDVRDRGAGPDADRLSQLISDAGGKVTQSSGSLTVLDIPAQRIGELAAASSVVLHELTPQRASLEEAFMELTADSVEYSVGGPQ
jgi:ABC-2 type transport system ATP-binding protein